MQTLDIVVLIGYFALMIGVGIVCSRWVKAQEDYFMGGRAFGKLLQTFAAFGAGTGSNDPILVGRTTWTGGLSGIWSVLMWLFCTPFYWIFAVWYRRMRHLTLGDWFVERYQSRGLGAAYTVFGITFYMMYLSTMLSAISKVAAPLIGSASVPLPGLGTTVDLKYVLVPIISLVVIVYGVLGGLRAAYWTDLIQGLCIIFLSVILIPAGLHALAVADAGASAGSVSLWDGFRVMHERMTAEYFTIVGGPRSGEFPLHYIVSLTLLVLVGIVVQPHMIATGGGSAKTEDSARMGLVVGNFLKRLCTIGWALTGLIVLALLAGNMAIERDPDLVWGIASRDLLGPMGLGLVGLMLACLLAALMSSVSAYMLVSSALVTRNVYAAYIRPVATERRYVAVGRITGLIIIVGAALVSLYFYNVFQQFLLAVELPIIFAAPFWIGMYWRRATRWAAWGTVAFSTVLFFVVPVLVPRLVPAMQNDPSWTITNDKVTTTIRRPAKYVDWAKYEGWRKARQAALAIDDAERRTRELDALGEKPPVVIGDPILDVFTTGGKPIFWTGKARPAKRAGGVAGKETIETIDRKTSGNTTVLTQRRVGQLECSGRFKVDFLVYRALGVDLTTKSDAMLTTLRLPTRIVLPFLVMILLSLVTPRTDESVLDRYYVKMKTPVDPDSERDRQELEKSYHEPSRLDGRRLFRVLGLEIQRPRASDAVGFVVCFVVCFLLVGLAMWLAGIGGP